MALEITADAFARLEAELVRLETNDLPDAVARIEAAREDSINTLESSTHLGALEERQRIEANIGRLRRTISDATIITAANDDGTIRSGSTVTVTDEDGDDMTVRIGTIHERAGDPDTLYTSPTSPLGEALLGARAGDNVTWNTPGGFTMTATIANVT